MTVQIDRHTLSRTISYGHTRYIDAVLGEWSGQKTGGERSRLLNDAPIQVNIEPNHYPGPIPIDDVRRRLFAWNADSRPIAVALPADVETMTHLDDGGRPARREVIDGHLACSRTAQPQPNVCSPTNVNSSDRAAVGCASQVNCRDIETLRS